MSGSQGRRVSRVLVTGATGLIGTALCAQLRQTGFTVRAAVRSAGALAAHSDESIVIGDLAAPVQLESAMEGVDAVVHAAARTHVLRDARENSKVYQQVNAEATRLLAMAAARAGVARFVFLSTIKVNGEECSRAYTADDAPHPQDAYGLSKWLAEQALHEVASASSLQAVVVRPPLVHGPGVKANFLRLLHWVSNGRPLPFGRIRNRRSLVSVWNLCDLIIRTLTHPAAPQRIWLVSDGEDLSTPDLARRLAAALQRPARLLPVPVGLLRAAAAALGRRAEIERLCSSLFVDITPAQQELCWRPPLSLDEGLGRTCAWYAGLSVDRP